jgi:NADP-dependent aldehyde dehydrogenase
MDLRGNQWIGSSESREGKDELQAVDPKTGEALEPRYVEATAAEVDRAFALAAEAHRSWKRLPRARRAELLDRVAEEIEALGDELLERAERETALPASPRLAGERGRTTGQLRMMAAVVREGSFLEPRIDRGQPDRTPLPKPDVRSLRQPLGPVAVFGASNFPLAFSVAGGDTAAAMAAGCPVVAKAHPNHPGTSEMVARAIRRAVDALGLPEGTFSLVHGRTPAVGAALVTHPEARAVGFTGSFAGGKALFDLAASRPRPIPVFAEMGSTNPVFLLPGALEERAEALAEGVAGSVTLGAGQFCTNPGLLIAVRGDATERFAAVLAQRLDAAPAGTLLHAGIRKGWDAGLRRLASVAGVSRLTAAAEDGPGCGARPAAFRTDAATFLSHPELAEEVFGPATVLVECRSADELLGLSRELGGQLTATVHGTAADVEAFGGLTEVLEEKAGRLVFGGYPTGVEVCPAMHHGGPFPATTDPSSTSVGTAAVRRFTRPVCYQNAPASVLPAELADENPEGILRLVDGEWSRS